MVIPDQIYSIISIDIFAALADRSRIEILYALKNGTFVFAQSIEQLLTQTRQELN